MTLIPRIIAGTAVYLLIVVLAAPFPGAAGLMLTFPALNGLSFFYEDQGRAGSIARSMLWMPVLNGALCAGYIVSFLVLAPAIAPNVLAWLLLAAVIVLWLALVPRKVVRNGIPAERQLGYALAATVIGALLTTIALLVADHFHSTSRVAVPARDAFAAAFLADALWANGWRVGLFAIALTVFLLATKSPKISDAARGILAGLPLVPFVGLFSVAGDDGLGIEQRRAILAGMGVSVWLSPAAPIWFICGYARYLQGRQRSDNGSADAAARFSVLVLGWLLCAAAIAAITAALSLLSS